MKKYLEELCKNGELLVFTLSKPLRSNHTVIVMQVDSSTRAKLIARGSEYLQHVLDLSRKYSDIGDRDRCMILRSNALFTITGLLELYRSVFEDGVVATMEAFLESRQRCEELLVLLADTSRQTIEEDGQRIENFIMVPPARYLPQRLANCSCSTTTTGARLHTTLKRSSVLSQPGDSRLLSYHFPHRVSGPLANVLWNGS